MKMSNVIKQKEAEDKDEQHEEEYIDVVEYNHLGIESDVYDALYTNFTH